MNPKKPDRSVANMDVLRDIRGLLSTRQERGESPARPADDGAVRAEKARLEEQIKACQEQIESYREQVRQQQDELRRLADERKELVAREMPRPVQVRPEAAPGAGKLHQEIAQLEARREELAAALAQIEDLLQLKAKELLRRIVRLYQEAGQDEIAIEFRRAGSALESVENFACFLRALLQQ